MPMSWHPPFPPKRARPGSFCPPEFSLGRHNRNKTVVFVDKDSIVPVMEGRFKAVGCLAILAASLLWTHANVEDNPYATIVTRNPFGLKDPPPPPPPPQQNVPATPPAKVTVTGFMNLFGQPQVLLEIFDEPGKGGGTPKKPILREGERMGAVEVLQIDVHKNTVKIRNSGAETNLTFDIAKAPTPGVPGVPGMPVPNNPPPIPGAMPPPTTAGGAGQPTVISGNANAGGSGVTLVGGGAAAAPAPTPSVNTAIDPATGLPTAGAGLRSIPNRPMRGGEAMTREQIEALHNSAQQKQANPSAPPMPFPAFPRPGGAPSVPNR